MIGRLERVPLREVWKHEARGFTTWLQTNLDALNEILDVTLSNAEREESAGAFNVDLLAEDESGNPVIIESQLEKSDHDHLGKVLTYLTALDAKRAIWIVSEPRPEHVRAVSWLNESASASFYLVKLEAVRIAESPPAPLLTLIVGPSEQSRDVGETKHEISERFALRRSFWSQLLERAKDKTKLHSGISPSESSWISTGAGRSGLSYNYVVGQHEARVELYIDRGKDSDQENKAIFDALAASKETIEAEFGEPLVWQRLEGKRASRIMFPTGLGGYRDEAKLQNTQDAMIGAMIRFEKALKPHIAKLSL